ncbi:MAG: hypothetical protein MJ093_09370 [Saccharofermentans sp.]|nr:hypothetical protein [Saccharofermentans sp.]
MKKFTATLLSLCLIMSLTSCASNDNKDKSDKKKKDNKIEINFDEDEATDTSIAVTEPSTEPTAEPPTMLVTEGSLSYIPYTIDSYKDSVQKQTNGYVINSVNCSIQSFILDSNEYPELQAAISQQNEDTMHNLLETNDAHKAAYHNTSNQDNFYASIDNSVSPFRSDDQVVSYITSTNINYHSEDYSNERTFATAYNYLSSTGEIITTDDIILDKDEFIATIYSQLNREIGFNYKYPLVDNSHEILTNLFINGDMAIALLLDGVHVVFPMNELADLNYVNLYSMKIPYYGNEDIFNSEYFTNLPENYVIEFLDNGYLEWDVTGDGYMDSIELLSNGGPYDNTAYSVILNGTETTIEEYGLGLSGKLIRYNGEYYIYMGINQEDDWHTIYVFKIDGDTAINTGSVEWRIRDIVDPNCFTMTRHTDALSTMGSNMDYCIGNDGIPEPLRDFYYLDGYMYVTTACSLDGQIIDGATYSTTDQVITIDAGTDLMFYASDLDSYVDFIVLNGSNADTILRFSADFKWSHDDDGPSGQRINNISVYDAFVYPFYAG